ncbi:MAG: hypothetical protein ACLTSX_04600 [Collinsella sp.]
MDNEEFEAEVIENERPAGEAEVIEGEQPVEEAEQALVLGDDDPRDAGLHEAHHLGRAGMARQVPRCAQRAGRAAERPRD